MNIRSMEHFEDVVDSFRADTKESKAMQERAKLYARIFSGDPLAGLVEGENEEYVKIYEDAEYLVYSPLTYTASSVFSKVTDWCTNFSENSFRDLGGTEGGLIYIFNKNFENAKNNYAIETLPGGKVTIWDYKNDEILKDVDYKTALAQMQLPAPVRTALTKFKLKSPTDIPEDIRAQIKKLVEFVGTQSHPKPNNFMRYASNLFENDKSSGLTILHAGIDLGGTSYRMWEALTEHERRILESLEPDEFTKFNRAFQRANRSIGMNASPDNIDEYLEKKYSTEPEEGFEDVKSGRGGGRIFSYFGTIGEGYINLFSEEEWFRIIYPYYRVAESMLFMYNNYRSWYDTVMSVAFKGIGTNDNV